MPKTVAVLEGDSTSLVKSIKEAQKAMLSLDDSGKTLSKQLKDVATEADKAAGSLVTRVGGQTAIKAIGGITLGIGAAQQALGVFSSSMAAFAATQGEAGAKAMADIDMALNELQGQLFTAVMGTDNMEEATQTLISGIKTMTSVVETLLTPLKWLGQFLKLIRDFSNENATATKRHADELNRLKTTQAQMKKSYDTNQTAIENNLKAVKALTGATEDNRKAQIQLALTATDAIAQQVLLAEKEQDIADYKAKVAADTIDNDLRARTLASDMLREGKIRADEFNSKMNLYFNNMQKDSRRNAIETVMVMSEATKVQLESLGAQRQVLAKELLGVTEQVKKEEEDRTSVGCGGDKKKTAEEIRKENLDKLAASLQARQDEIDALAALREKNDREERAIEDQKLRDTAERLEKEIKAKEEAMQRVKDFEAKMLEEHNAELHAQGKLTAEEQDELDKELLKQKTENIKAGLQEYGKASMQQLAIGKKASAVAADLARKAIGDAISAKGDEAMAQAAIYAAALNPQAIPMAAAGVAAYAAAAMLGSSGKKATSSTPASAVSTQAAPVNTSFNLRVDAAFADGESIARQFATMQRAAQARGLVPAGAF